MAEEDRNGNEVSRIKSGVVLNKHKAEPPEPPKTAEAAAQPKRKILIKRNPMRVARASQEAESTRSRAAGESPASDMRKKMHVRVVSRKAPESTPDSAQPASQLTTDTGQKATEISAAATAQTLEPQRLSLETANRIPHASEEKPSSQIIRARPNIKAGNLRERGDTGDTGARYRTDSFSGSKARAAVNPSYRSGNQRQGFIPRSPRQGDASSQRSSQFRRGPGSFSRTGGAAGGARTGVNRGPFANRGGFGTGRGTGAAPIPPTQGRSPARKGAQRKRQSYRSDKEREELFNEEELYQKRKRESALAAVPSEIEIMETVTVSDLARKMNLKASEIISRLMSMGMMVTINQTIDSDTATILAAEYNCQVKIISLYDETVIARDEGAGGEERTRPPIVTVMGHVDHGKTKTLDAIRNTNVAAGEAGGITQKIGAYQVTTDKGPITFLDTPGHEAFTMMRARGAQITDIVVLVVAADDGVMPQTIEAINHARDAKVPIIVAVNKIDKAGANPERVMTQLSELGLTPEAWGGDTQFVNISALKREGIEDLLDAIQVQAEVLDLKTQYDCRAEGKVIESRTDQGRGVVASVIVQRGTLRTGDPIVAGIYAGRVRAMFNDRGERVKEAPPSMPVEVIGLEAMPNAGDPIQVTESEKDARAYALKRQELRRQEEAKAVRHVTLDNLYSTIEASEVKEFKIIIKADLQGSAEALKTALEKLSTKELRVNVIHSSAGAINESDVTLAAADENAIIIGFNVRPTPKAKALADQENVEIRRYNIIYKCVEEIQQAMEGMLSPDTKEETVGSAEVRETFKVSRVGTVAGCYVTDGIVKRTSSVNVVRDGVVIYTGKIASLRRFKDDVREVKVGFECGIMIQDYQDVRVGDTLEVFDVVQVRRTLESAKTAETATGSGSATGDADSTAGGTGTAGE